MERTQVASYGRPAWARFICVPDRLSTAAVPPAGRLKRKLVGRSEKVIR